MKFANLLLLASSASAQANSANSTEEEWAPIPCETTEDCQIQETLDKLTLEFDSYGDTYEGNMENIVCAHLIYGAD